MSVRKNIAVARKFNEEIVNGRYLDRLAEVLHENYQWRGGTKGPWSAPAEFHGLDAVRKAYAGYFEKFPDWKVVIEDIFGQKDSVAIRMTFWKGQKPFRNTIAIYHFSGGKIIDDWACGQELKE